MTPRRFLRALLALCAVLPSLAQAGPEPPAIGFERVEMPDGTEVGVWYPAPGVPARQRLGLYEQDAVTPSVPAGRGLPLVVMSHGTGGVFSGHLDTAAALARAGFVVAALTHPGDNYRDGSRSTQMGARAAGLVSLIGYMLEGWPSHGVIDPGRVGAFGFSAGGFTVLAAAGGRPDLSRLAEHCATHPAFFDCGVVRSREPGGDAAMAGFPPRDGRIRAVVVAAPALGFTFGAAGLRDVTVPVQLWKAGEDRILPAPFYADAVRAALPGAPEFHEAAGAGHFDFLAPCAPGAPAIPVCASAPGFDRGAFHERFNAEVVRFLSGHLRGG